MQKNNSDRFETFSKGVRPVNNENFFLMDTETDFFSGNPQTFDSARRLNDYDSNLLREDAYKDVADELFKLEYKITRIETEIKSLESQIQAAFDISDEALIDELINRKTILEEEYETLISAYNQKSFSTRITESLFSIFGGKLKSGVHDLKKRFSSLSELILERMPKSFTSALELKRSLAKLENINNSVDELVNMSIPYGEDVDKYNKLSKYIVKANNIQAEISKYMKEK